MAVEVTAADLAIELRISVDGDDLDDAQTAVMTRLVSVATALVDSYAGDAPDAIQEEAIIRVGAFLYDVVPGSSNAPQNAMVSSGAQALLSPWRVQRGWIIGGDEPETIEDSE